MNKHNFMSWPFVTQLVGNYTLNLNNLSSYAMHPWMDERCPSLDPHYQRPKGC